MSLSISSSLPSLLEQQSLVSSSSKNSAGIVCIEHGRHLHSELGFR